VDDIWDSCGSCVGIDGWDQETGHRWTTGYIYLDAMSRLRRAFVSIMMLSALAFDVCVPPSFTSQTSHIPRYDKWNYDNEEIVTKRKGTVAGKLS